MYKIRAISYTSTSVSIQVYKIVNRKRVIIRHIGTARNEQEKTFLLSLADDFINKASKQLSLFENAHSLSILNLNQSEFIGVYFTFLSFIIIKISDSLG